MSHAADASIACVTTAFLTDQYELTMVEAAIQSGKHDRQCMFEVFARHLPVGRRYGIVAGTGRLLELIEQFTFTDAELNWLSEQKVVNSKTLEWLANYSFRGTVWGYQEGEAYFPGSPVLVVEGTFAEAVLLETLVLSVLNFDTAVASAAARMVSAAIERPVAEMGSRRANEMAAVAAARASFIAGFTATSNLEAGRRWSVPTMGTAAHSFTLLHDSEDEAFRAQVAALGASTTLLVDTYDVSEAVGLAVKIAGPELGGVRIDSGDLATQVEAVREQLDSLGAVKTTITVTSDLDEYAIAALAASPVDAYGVGTSVVTGSGAPTAGMVYKLVAHKVDGGEWLAVAKKSVSKLSVGGRKYPVRQHGRDGTATAEVVYITQSPTGPDGVCSDQNERPLLVELMRDGVADPRFTGPAGTRLAREHRATSLQALPAQAFRLVRGDPVIPTEYRESPATS